MWDEVGSVDNSRDMDGLAFCGRAFVLPALPHSVDPGRAGKVTGALLARSFRRARASVTTRRFPNDPAPFAALPVWARLSAGPRRIVRAPHRSPAAARCAIVPPVTRSPFWSTACPPRPMPTTERPTSWDSSGARYTLRVSNHSGGASRRSCRSTAATPSTGGRPTFAASGDTWFRPGAPSTSTAGGSRTPRRRRSGSRRCPTHTPRAPAARGRWASSASPFSLNAPCPPTPTARPPLPTVTATATTRAPGAVQRRSEAGRGRAAAGGDKGSASEESPLGEASADDAIGAGRAKSEAQPYARRVAPGLGTEYGEAVSSPIHEVEFVRASAARPAAILGMRYNDRDGLVAMGIRSTTSRRLRRLGRHRPAANGRAVPGDRPPLRGAAGRLAARLRMEVAPARMVVWGERRGAHVRVPRR